MQTLRLDDDEVDEKVELVTLTVDQLTRGVGMGNAQPFSDVQHALAHAKSGLTQDERDCSWIRDGENVIPLAITADPNDARSTSGSHYSLLNQGAQDAPVSRERVGDRGD